MTLNPDFWNQRYLDQNTPWDIGGVSPPLQSFLDQIDDNKTSILIPGAGRAYEAIYLHELGFVNVFVCDWAEEIFRFLLEKAPGFPEENLICADFFQLEGQFDLVLEQTFFCAIDPVHRPQYVRKVHQLLKPGGMLAGVLFASGFERPGPPFGGSMEEYRELFNHRFLIDKMEICKNSIRPRAGNEVFFKLIKK
jgi:methyl halide transferase